MQGFYENLFKVIYGPWVKKPLQLLQPRHQDGRLRELTVIYLSWQVKGVVRNKGEGRVGVHLAPDLLVLIILSHQVIHVTSPANFPTSC